MEFGESIDVGFFLLRSGYIFSDLKAIIVSNSSRMWLLASAQVGIGEIFTCALSQEAEENRKGCCSWTTARLSSLAMLYLRVPISY
jgi:hypothetical protein